MKRLLRLVAIAVGICGAAVVAHLAVIEIGREVVTLRTQRSDGTWYESRLWIVDDGGVSWVHSAGPKWVKRFDGDPIVEVKRNGEIRRYRAHAVPGPHPRVDELLRAKYGLADRWVRFIGPDTEDVVVVRLEPVPDPD